MAHASRGRRSGERSGRRPGRPDTRGVILTAARESFAGKGFAGTSMRGIAAAAGVDPALIHHYFDSKRALFLATVALPIDPPALITEVAAGDKRTFGPRLLTTLLRTWDSDQQTALVAALRAALSDPAMTRPLVEFLSVEVLGQLVVGRPEPAEAERRAGLVATTLLGVIVGRYLLELPALTGQSADDLVATLGPVLQRYLDGELDGQLDAEPEPTPETRMERR